MIELGLNIRMCFVFSIKLSFGYLNLDLNFKVMDLKWFNFKSLNIKVCFIDF